MSPRKRHTSRVARPAPAAPSYPSPAERQTIIERRDDLLYELIGLFVAGVAPDDPRLTKLALKYGPGEVKRVTDTFARSSARRDFLVDEPQIYREYRHSFARFGGERRFLNKPEFEELTYEYGKLAAMRKFKLPIPRRPGHRERELRELLLSGVGYWEDVTPPATPPRPADFVAPPGGEYTGPEKDLLAWGWELDLLRVRAQAKNVARWHPAISDLVRMVFDEGLLSGWPGEPASWVPYHALHLLGALQAHQHAAKLVALAKRENDWLSDRLPAVWGQMGEQVEPALWTLLDDGALRPDPRGLAAAGLRILAQTYPRRRTAIVEGLASRLSAPPPCNAVVNGFIVFALNRLKAVEAREVISTAFEQGKVARNIVQPEDVDFLDR